LLFRTQPAGDVHLSVLQPARRLGDVPRHAHRADPFLMAGAGRADAAAIAAVLAFWREAGPERWFGKDDAFDARFRATHLGDRMAAAAGRCDRWADTADGALALLILLGQFPRNAFRGSAHMYATDPLARMFSRHAVAAGLD